MKQVKIFGDCRNCDKDNGNGLSEDINNWIRENNINVIDIKVSTNIWPTDIEYGWHPEHSYTATVIYEVGE